MKRLWKWLKAEWEICKRQAECDHDQVDDDDACVACGYDISGGYW